MRKLIAGMQISVDGKIARPEGYADWMEVWPDAYGLMPQVDACLLGAGMYPRYEQRWTEVQQTESDKPLPIAGTLPSPADVKWARFAARTPHYVLSSTLTSALWPNTSFLRGLEEVGTLKQQPGKDMYLIGGRERARALSMPGSWMSSGLSFIR
jgi:hypothetical protein